jgi:hypothetical protein
MLEGTVVARTRAVRRARLSAVVAIALAAAFVTWLILRPDGDTAPIAKAVDRTSAAELASPARLRSLATTLSHPVYWAGPRAGMRYELTQADGRTYIRYLPLGVATGDPRAGFLAIGSYAAPNAFAQTRSAGAQPGAVMLALPGGGVAVYSAKRPTSVYFAYRGSDVQVEVYHPDGRAARQLVLTRQVVPIR